MTGPAKEPAQATIERHELETLLAVARLYLATFTEDERMTLPEKLAFQDVEAVVAKYDTTGPDHQAPS